MCRKSSPTRLRKPAPIQPGHSGSARSTACVALERDGHRLRVERDGERVRLITKGGDDWTKRFPWIVGQH